MTIEKTRAKSDDTGKMPTFRRLRDVDRTVSPSGDDIRGRMVRDKDGHEIGKIETLLVDDAEGKIRLMEVASGGFLGFGETKSLIPIEAIARMTNEDVFISHTREHVAGAPRYDPDLVEADPGYFFGLYPYYGYPGYMGAAVTGPAPWITSWPGGAGTRGPGG